jgi:hypothetical protein
VKSNFDVRHMIRLICKSRTYQLSIATNQWNRDDDQNYSHATARRLPAEVLFDAIHRATGRPTRLPGLPAGARAAQLLDSNVELPGGFLELFGKPVRESACECERSNTMMLGPVLAMVNGPIVADAIKNPDGALAKFTLATKDDAKVVEEIYLSVLNRRPTAAETAEGVKALRAAGPDHARLLKLHTDRVNAFTAYEQTVPDRQKKWEAGLLTQKPTEWTVVKPTSAKSKAGPTPAAAKDASTLTVQKDQSVLVSGKLEPVDIYTVTIPGDAKKTYTALRIETLTDPGLPAKGPGRAANGNFVLNELRVNWKPADKSDAKPKPVKLQKPSATLEQGGFPVANAIDNNPGTGWAIAPGAGKDQAALFEFAQPVTAPNGGAVFTVVMDQRFGGGHTIGKFRLSLTTEKNPRLGAPVAKDVIAMLETHPWKRTAEVKKKLRNMYIAQDLEYRSLQSAATNPPPADPRVLGAQDLVWALINSPAFLFNH